MHQINLAPFTITLSILHVVVFIVSIILNFLASDYASYGRKLGTGSCTQVNYTWKWIVFFVKSFSRNFSWNHFHEKFRADLPSAGQRLGKTVQIFSNNSLSVCNSLTYNALSGRLGADQKSQLFRRLTVLQCRIAQFDNLMRLPLIIKLFYNNKHNDTLQVMT